MDAAKSSPGKPVRSLYICYFPLTEPLVETQVLSYLGGLVREGHVIHLLTYETDRPSRAVRAERRRALEQRGIRWHGLNYHKRPTLPATLFDIVAGIVTGWWVVRRHRLRVVHARVHVPGAIALVVKRLTGALLIFDLRGLMAEEYEEAGSWRRGSAPYRLVKWVERKCLEEASAVVVLTRRVRQALFREDARGVFTIPCCADLDRISSQAGERERMREELGLAGKTVLAYAGKFGGFYLGREMVDFYLAARREFPDLHFLVLTQSDPELIRAEFARHDIPAGSAYTVTRAEPGRIGSFLAAADLAISFREAGPSQIAASPTKIGEYLAAGLPVVCNSGIGDMDELIADNRVGVLVPSFDEAAYHAAAVGMRELLADREISARCRRVAEETSSLEDIGIPRYLAVYASVGALLESGGRQPRGGGPGATLSETSARASQPL